eukprot:TRINITY_DN28023_c0_g1_i1.p1 TRINITY_DN28023_c0_g1~~TRINITY_DN28023_c0_g1_i1.p1  ORF type:complete len:429 (-),score=48.35 TRINITY_DN28023_c0_g1_i1:369-1655(-)
MVRFSVCDEKPACMSLDESSTQSFPSVAMSDYKGPVCEKFPTAPACGCTIPCAKRRRQLAANGVILNPAFPTEDEVQAARLKLQAADEAADKYVDKAPADLHACGHFAEGGGIHRFRVLSWNVWFSPHGAGERWRHILAEAERLAPMIIAFQEATPAFARMVAREAWVVAGYVCSDDGDGLSVAPEGELLVVRREVSRFCLGVEFDSVDLPSDMGRRLVFAHISCTCAGKACASSGMSSLSSSCSFLIATAHLESKTSSFDLRLEQLSAIKRQLEETAPVPEDASESPHKDAHAFASYAPLAIFCGDTNLELEEDDAALDVLGSGWLDIWQSLHPGEAGFTYDSKMNGCAASHQKGIQREGCDAAPRQARYDRFYIRSEDCLRAASCLTGKPGRVLRPCSINLVGTDPLTDDLWPSDHFGLLAEFEIG